MPLYEFFKNLFGFSNPRQPYYESNNDYRNQFLNPENDYFEDSVRFRQSPRDSEDITSFNIFTDPTDMHKYFESQINDLLKSFGIFGLDDKAFFDSQDIPAINPPQNFNDSDLNPSTNLRDHLLKPGYHSTKDGGSMGDTDVDGKINSDDLDSLIKNKPQEDKIPKQRSLFQRSETMMPEFRTFGQSISSKTIRMPDGTVETHRTIKDNQGNEETTITRQIGDKHYTVTVRTDKNGRQETIEDMKNIDENEVSRFTDKWKQHPPSLLQPQTDMNVDLIDWFEKIFIK